jgi:hypothetical protein
MPRKKRGGDGKFSRRTALMMIGGGGLLAVSGTGAFTQIEGDRGFSVNTTTDPNALLGLSDVSNNAEVSNEGDVGTVYEITDNIGSLSASDIDVSVVKLVAQNGIENTNPPVEATVQGTGGGPFDVEISCTSETDALGDSYQVVLDFAATTDDTSVTATRSSSSFVNISCTIDYGDSSNYRDGSGGDAARPPLNEASGDIENPSAVNEDGGGTATAISSGGQEDLNVGFSLPAVDGTATEYEMIFDITRIQVGGGTFGFYLVNSAGTELTTRQVLSTGTNSYSFPNSEDQDIAENNDELYLIIDSETNGKGNRELEIDYFNLQSV